MTVRTASSRLGLALLLLAILAFTLGPFIWQIVTSFKPDEELGRLPPLLPSRWVTTHYRSVLADPAFLRIMGNSLGIAGISTALAVLLGSFAAYALAKLRFRGGRLLLGVVVGVSMFPPIATVSPLFLVVRWLGLRDTWTALIATYTTFTLPMAIFILTTFFRDIPDELREAALMDGCTPLEAYTKIVLPLAAPGLSAASILVFIQAWNEFLFALTFTATEASRTVPVGIALFPGIHEVPWGEIAAASVVVTLPLVALVLIFQRRIVSGLTAGAVKG